MIRLALWTGFRQGELIALAKPAIDFARNRVFVVNPKWRKDKRKTEGNPIRPSRSSPDVPQSLHDDSEVCVKFS